MAITRGLRRRYQLPTPPKSPDQETPRPLPLPTEMSRYKSWQAARSRSWEVKNTSATPQTPLRSVSDPVVSTIWYTSPESTEPKEEAKEANRYTQSYYNILGLPENSNVTTKDVEDAYRNLLSKPPLELSHDQETLHRAHKTLTNPIRRRTYDLGRKAHLLVQSHHKDRELREGKMTPNIPSQEAKVSVNKTRVENSPTLLEMKKKEVEEVIYGKVKRGALSMTTSMRLRLGLDGMYEEEGIPYEELNIDLNRTHPTGERLSLDFEFLGSGSEEDSEEGSDSGGTFSDKEEEIEKYPVSEKSKDTEVSTVAVPTPEMIPLPEDKPFDFEEESVKIKDQSIEVSGIHKTTFIPDEEVVYVSCEPDHTKIETFIDLMFPTESAAPTPITETISYKEIWEPDYDSSSDCPRSADIDTDTEIESDTATDTESDEEDSNTHVILQKPQNKDIVSATELKIWEPDYLCNSQPDCDKEIWESSYNGENDTSEVKWLVASVTVSMILVSAGFAWFGHIAV